MAGTGTVQIERTYDRQYPYSEVIEGYHYAGLEIEMPCLKATYPAVDISLSKEITLGMNRAVAGKDKRQRLFT